MSRVAKVKFADYKSSIAKALDLIGAAARLPQEGLIIIKPNLTNSSPPPVTTSVTAVEAVYDYCKHCDEEHVRHRPGQILRRLVEQIKAAQPLDGQVRCGCVLVWTISK